MTEFLLDGNECMNGDDWLHHHLLVIWSRSRFPFGHQQFSNNPLPDLKTNHSAFLQNYTGYLSENASHHPSIVANRWRIRPWRRWRGATSMDRGEIEKAMPTMNLEQVRQISWSKNILIKVNASFINQKYWPISHRFIDTNGHGQIWALGLRTFCRNHRIINRTPETHQHDRSKLVKGIISHGGV